MLPKSTSKDIKVLEPNLSVSENIQVLIPDTFSVDDNNNHDNQNSSLANKITKKNIVELPKIIPSATKNNLTVPALTSPIKKTAQRILNDININNELLLFFDNECWVEIQAGSNILLSELYSKGDSLSLSVAYPFSLKVGNVYAIKGTYQGLDIDFITGADRLNVNTIFYLND
jgi:cytoskeletal protein RodZ